MTDKASGAGIPARDPVKGDVIYVDDAYFVYRGREDFAGGLATVSRVERSTSMGRPCLFVAIVERPGVVLNWTEVLCPKQESLREKFADRVAHADPDLRLEFNCPNDDWK